MTKHIFYTDDNFLNGKLNISICVDKKYTEAHFTIYDEDVDEIMEFIATAKCKKDDEFNEQTGIDIVKLKIVKNYYSFKKNCARHKIDILNKELNEIQTQYNYFDKKYTNTANRLKDYGLDIFGLPEVKPTKKNKK